MKDLKDQFIGIIIRYFQTFLKNYAANENIRERPDASFQGVSKLFVLAYQRGDNYANEDAFN